MSHVEVMVGVQATLAAYAQAMDAGRTDELVALFLPDGTAQIAGVGTFQGHDAIRQAYADMVPRRPQLHLVGNTVVTSWTAEEATAISDFVFLQLGASGWTVPVTGRYDDSFRKAEDGRWLILRKTVTYVS
ncbi:MAG: nuclear transport factor 2 family protein [Mycobacteriales bacterium]